MEMPHCKRCASATGRCDTGHLHARAQWFGVEQVIRQERPRMPVLIFSMHTGTNTRARIRAGASGDLSKEVNGLLLPAYANW